MLSLKVIIVSGEVALSSEPQAVMRDCVSKKDYAGGYKYVEHIVIMNIVAGDATGDPRTANWLEIAATVNRLFPGLLVQHGDKNSKAR